MLVTFACLPNTLSLASPRSTSWHGLSDQFAYTPPNARNVISVCGVHHLPQLG